MPLLFSEGWSIILLKIVEKDYLKGENGVGLKVTFYTVCPVPETFGDYISKFSQVSK